MTRKDVAKALTDGLYRPKEIRTNDGEKYVVKNLEHWAIFGENLLVVPDGAHDFAYLALRNIAAIGPARRHRRRA